MSAVAGVARVVGVAVGSAVAVWLSAHITVRMPLVVPIVLIGVVLILVAAMFRRPPAGVFERADTARTPTSTAIPMPATTEPPAPPASPVATWTFDEPDAAPDEGDW